MRTRLLTLMLGVLALVGFSACSNDDDDIKIDRVPDAYKTALAARYPQAGKVKWEKDASYYIADFKDAGVDYDVWFAPEAQWAMTELEYGTDLQKLPAQVILAFTNSDYREYRVDDVSAYERTADTFYIIEVEQTGAQDTYLYYDAEGNLLKSTTQDIDIRPDTAI